jgi:DNA helicase-2/ATP-dependent DNA helicase PcrA
MYDLSTLNPEQREAVTQTHGPIMILAGAGTGKTRVITFRIAYMLRSGISADTIVALSFTNKAAREMAERVQHLIGDRAKKVWMGTFHSFCLSLLRQFANEADLVPGFGLADTSDQIELVGKALEEKGWSGLYQADRLHYQIGIAKNHLLSPEDIKRGQGREKIQGDAAILSEVYALYERQLKLHRVIDFDDCIYKTVRLLETNAAVRAASRKKFQFLMVDEYQDTNSAQLKVLELLASDGHDVCVVGDDDQSIYSWRGAMYEVLEHFEQLFPKARIIKLEQNYRCTNIILGAANQVIRCNTKRKDKTLWSASTDQTPLTLVPCEDEVGEAKFVTEKCLSLLGAGLEPKDIAILYRANAQAKTFELSLREARIPSKTYGGQSFFERKEVKDFVCYLRLVLESEDRLALWRVINTPNRGIGLKTLERIEADARASHKSPYQVMASMDTPAVKRFAELMESLRQMPLSTPEELLALGHAILKQAGLENDVKIKTDNAPVRERKLQNLRSLPQWIAGLTTDLIKRKGHFERRALLDILTLDNDRRDDKKNDGNHVALMTIHASKGLEFPAVFLVGLEEEQLPHKNSIQDPNAICEERRLFYVALTRAKTRLYLSHCIERQSGFQGRVLRAPSRFLDELPKGSFEYVGDASSAQARVKSETERKQQTVSKLSALRGALQASKAKNS